MFLWMTIPVKEGGCGHMGFHFSFGGGCGRPLGLFSRSYQEARGETDTCCMAVWRIAKHRVQDV